MAIAGSVHVLLRQSTVLDVVTSVSDEGEPGTREDDVEYARRWTDTPEVKACIYPQPCPRRGMPVVQRQVVSRGSGELLAR